MRRMIRRIYASPIAERLLSAAGWSFAGTVLGRLLALISQVLLARLLGAQGFGELMMVLTTLGLFQMFAELGLGMTCAKYVAEARRNDVQKAARIIGLSVVVAVGMGLLGVILAVCVASWLSTNLLGAPYLADLVRIGSLKILFSALNSVQVGALAGLEAFRTIAHVNCVSGLLTLACMTVGALWFDITGAVWGSSLAMALTWVFAHFAQRLQTRKHGLVISFHGLWRERTALWAFSIPAILGDSIAAPATWASSALLVNQPNGFIENGVYNAASQLFTALCMIPTILGAAILPILSEQIASNEIRNVKKIVLASVLANIALMLPCIFIGCIFSSDIMALYGREFKSSSFTLIVSIITCVFVGVLTPALQLIAASGRMWAQFRIKLGWSIVMVAIVFWSVSLGALGVAFARLVAYAVIGVLVAAWLLQFSGFFRHPSDEENS